MPNIVGETFLREQLIPALRSGDYQQTNGRLRDQFGFCCLGVICDLVDATKWERRGLEDGCYIWDGAGFTLPYTLAKKLDVTTDIHLNERVLGYNKPLQRQPHIEQNNTTFSMLFTLSMLFHPNEDTIKLAFLNDFGVTFESIADILEYALDVDAFVPYSGDVEEALKELSTGAI